MTDTIALANKYNAVFEYVAHPDHDAELVAISFLTLEDLEAFRAECVREIKQEAVSENSEFELWQDGMMMASASGLREDALREVQHYADQYIQDGPIEMFEVVRIPLSQPATIKERIKEGRT